MFARRQIVLVDTNVIIEAHRTRCFTQLAQYFELHTVETVVVETQTGHQNRRPEETIDYALLRSQLRHVEDVTDLARIEFALAYPDAILDDGERDLLIYAGTLPAKDVWFLNSPDKAAIRFGHQRRWLDRFVSLEAMVNHLKLRPIDALKGNYTERWLSEQRTLFQLSKL